MDSSRQCLHKLKPGTRGGRFVARALTVFCLSALLLALLPWFILSTMLVERPIVGDRGSRVLIVTAHPDDETIFFSPTITALASRGVDVFLLCLTDGNARGLGLLRMRELKQAVRHLKILEDHVTVVSSTVVQDGHEEDWGVDVVAEYIAKEASERHINTVVTFDGTGVTRHRNHVAVHSAARMFLQDCQKNSGAGCPSLWELQSTKGLRKFNSFLDVLPSSKGDRGQDTACYINHRISASYLAFYAHHSQWRWWMHMFFTRYSFVNTLIRVR